MEIEAELQAEQTEHGWKDTDGLISSIRPGTGPRRNPQGDFPTGPAVGSVVPNVRCQDADGNAFDLSKTLSGRSTVFLFNRSGVW